jgi:hypothetical protein
MKLKDFFRRWNNPSDPDASLRSSITHFDIHAEKDREGDGWSVGENDDLRWVATCSVRWETDAYPPLLLTQSACGRTRQIEGRRESPEETMARCLDDLHEMLDTGVNRARSLSRRILMSASNARPILTLVLGAGFSCAFGVPTTDGLAGWLSRPCPRFGDLVSNYWSSFPSAFEDAKKESVLGIFGQDKEIKNIEVLLSMWHGERDQWDQTGLTHGTHQDYRCFLENMVAWFVHWSNEAEIGETNKRRFESMVRWLKEAVKRYDVRIVTFNYDLIIERLCRAAGVEFAYFEDGMSRSRVLIRKVHGSANFFEASVGIPQTAQVVFDIDQSVRG